MLLFHKQDSLDELFSYWLRFATVATVATVEIGKLVFEIVTYPLLLFSSFQFCIPCMLIRGFIGWGWVMCCFDARFSPSSSLSMSHVLHVSQKSMPSMHLSSKWADGDTWLSPQPGLDVLGCFVFFLLRIAISAKPTPLYTPSSAQPSVTPAAWFLILTAKGVRLQSTQVFCCVFFHPSEGQETFHPFFWEPTVPFLLLYLQWIAGPGPSGLLSWWWGDVAICTNSTTVCCWIQTQPRVRHVNWWKQGGHTSLFYSTWALYVFKCMHCTCLALLNFVACIMSPMCLSLFVLPCWTEPPVIYCWIIV